MVIDFRSFSSTQDVDTTISTTILRAWDFNINNLILPLDLIKISPVFPDNAANVFNLKFLRITRKSKEFLHLKKEWTALNLEYLLSFVIDAQ